MAAIGKSASQTEYASDPDFSSTLVPVEARMNKWSLMMTWWALCSAMFYLVVAAALTLQYGSINTIVGLFGAVIAYAVVNGPIARFAIRTGLSVALFSKLVFGKTGGLIATAIFFLMAIYYAVFEGSVIAVAIQDYFRNLELWHAYLIVVAYSIPLVFGSISTWMDKLNGYLLPLYVIFLVTAVVMAIDQYGLSNDWLSMGPQGGELDSRAIAVFTYFMGVWVIMMYTWDYARFGKEEDADFHARINFGMPFYVCSFLLNGLVGIFLVSTIKMQGEVSETTVVYAIMKLMGVWGLIFIWVSQTRINTANFQISTVNIQTFIKQITRFDISKVICAFITGAIIFAIMLTNIFSYVLEALAFQAIFIVSWVGIALVKIYFYNRYPVGTNYEELASQQSAINWSGVGVWTLASVAGLIMQAVSPASAVYAAPTTFIVSVVGYAVLEILSTQSDKLSVENQ